MENQQKMNFLQQNQQSLSDDCFEVHPPSEQDDQFKQFLVTDLYPPHLNETFDPKIYLEEGSQIFKLPTFEKIPKIYNDFIKGWYEVFQFMKEREGSQDKNVLKFIGRIFMKFDKKYSQPKKRSSRLKEIKEVFDNECQGNQGKINLSFFRILFKESRFNKQNRRILFHILGDYQILSQKIFHNGNVKKEIKYLYACKLMRLRCKSAILCQRGQCR